MFAFRSQILFQEFWTKCLISWIVQVPKGLDAHIPIILIRTLLVSAYTPAFEIMQRFQSPWSAPREWGVSKDASCVGSSQQEACLWPRPQQLQGMISCCMSESLFSCCESLGTLGSCPIPAVPESDLCDGRGSAFLTWGHCRVCAG